MSSGTILDRILETKRTEIAALYARHSLDDLIARCTDLPSTRGFKAALETGNTFRLIAEVKKASPSKGMIRADFEPVSLARDYQAGGASCLSVLTDETYFQGHLSYLMAIREVVSLPLLRKDFLVDDAQIYQARLAGADAILLIVAAIPDATRLQEMRERAESLGLDVLVEVHDRDELETAKASGASLIGVNNRDLRTFDVRLETTLELLPHFPPDAVAVAESGVYTREDASRLHHAGAHAMLVGESLMRRPDVAQATRELLGAV